MALVVPTSIMQYGFRTILLPLVLQRDGKRFHFRLRKGLCAPVETLISQWNPLTQLLLNAVVVFEVVAMNVSTTEMLLAPYKSSHVHIQIDRCLASLKPCEYIYNLLSVSTKYLNAVRSTSG